MRCTAMALSGFTRILGWSRVVCPEGSVLVTPRVSTRDNLIYVTLAALAAVVAATRQAQRHELLLPPVCLVLGWIYLSNDQKVPAIGRRIRTVISPRLQRLVTGDAPPAPYRGSNLESREAKAHGLGAP
jgi:hypothetical protein